MTSELEQAMSRRDLLVARGWDSSRPHDGARTAMCRAPSVLRSSRCPAAIICSSRRSRLPNAFLKSSSFFWMINSGLVAAPVLGAAILALHQRASAKPPLEPITASAAHKMSLLGPQRRLTTPPETSADSGGAALTDVRDDRRS